MPTVSLQAISKFLDRFAIPFKVILLYRWSALASPRAS
jgi:hypothetical protein